MCVGGWVVAERRVTYELAIAFNTINSHVITSNEGSDHSVMVVISQLV